MMRGKGMLSRLSQFSAAVAAVSLTCCLLHAQAPTTTAGRDGGWFQ